MRSWKEIKDRVPIFGSAEWDRMKDAIRRRVEIAEKNRAVKKLLKK